MEKSILVAIDFSDNALDALAYAELYAKDNEIGKVVLFHSIEDLTKKEASEKLDDWIESRNTSLEYIHFLNTQDFNDGIQEVNETYNIDCIFMGITGRHKIGQKLIGSQVFKLVEHIPVPLVVVPAGVSYMKIDNAALALGFDPALKEKVPYEAIKAWKNEVKSHLTIINVGNKKEDKQSVYQGLTDVFEMFDDIEPAYHFPTGSDVAELILEFINANHIQILLSVSGSYGFLERLFNPSVTKKIAYASNVPLMIFPQNKS